MITIIVPEMIVMEDLSMGKKNIESMVDIYSFIASEEVRDYFRKNREFTIQEKLRIILTSWKPFTEKMDAISVLKTEVTGKDTNSLYA